MKTELFGLRRANGDWFVMEVNGGRRVPIFRSLSMAWRARAKNDELMLFWPAPLTASVLSEIANDASVAGFWLVDEEDATLDLRHGHALDHLQVAMLEGLKEVPSGLRPGPVNNGKSNWVRT